MNEMSEKIGRFDEMQQEYEQLVQQLQEARNQNEFLEKKIGEYAENV